MSRTVSKMGRKLKRFGAAGRRTMKRLNRAINRVGMALATGLKAGFIAATVALAGLAVVIGRVAGQMDKLAKQSKRLDFPIEELQQWQFVAQQAGLTTEEFSKGLDTFSKTVGEAKLGQGALTTMLKRNDPAFLKQLKNTKDTSEAFDLYIKKMQSIDDPQKRMAFGALAFGRAGKKLGNIATLTADEIAKLKKEMLDNGIVTAEQAKAAENFNDAMNSMKLRVMGFLYEALGPLLPELTKVLREVRAWTVENKELIKTKVIDFVKKLVQGAKDFYQWLIKFNDQYKPIEKIGKALEVVGKLMNWVADNPDKVKAIGTAFLVAAAAIKVFTAALTVASAVAAANPLVLAFAAAVVGVGAAVVQIIRYWDELKIAFGWLWDDIKSIFTDGIGKVLNPIAFLVSSVKDIKAAWDPTKGFFENLWNSIVAVFEGAYNSIEDFVSRIVNTVKSLRLKDLFPSHKNPLGLVGKLAMDFVTNSGGGVTTDGGGATVLPSTVSPEQLMGRSIEEKVSTNKTVLEIKTPPGTSAEVTGQEGTNEGLTIQTSGGA